MIHVQVQVLSEDSHTQGWVGGFFFLIQVGPTLVGLCYTNIWPDRTGVEIIIFIYVGGINDM